jgi:hypothetical protein
MLRVSKQGKSLLSANYFSIRFLIILKLRFLSRTFELWIINLMVTVLKSVCVRMGTSRSIHLLSFPMSWTIQTLMEQVICGTIMIAAELFSLLVLRLSVSLPALPLNHITLVHENARLT